MEELWFFQNGHKRRAKKIICLSCSKEFLARLNGNNKFCSRECSFLGSKKTIEVICSMCKKPCHKNPSKLKNSKSGFYFCDRKCKEKAQRIGGIKEIMPPHYGQGNGKYCYRDIIKLNSKCIDCFENKPYYLFVHHIDGNRNNNVIENLEIVCANCHIKRHLKNVDGKWIYHPSALTPRDVLNEL